MKNIKLGIIDDSIFCRNLTKLQLSNLDSINFDFVIEAESIADFESKADIEIIPQVILLDIMMPGIDGVSGIPFVKALYPNAHIIMLSDIDNPAIIRKSILAGAYAFVKKGTKSSELVNIILDVLSGTSYPCHELTKSLFDGVIQPPQSRRKLSDQELSIVHLLLEGLSFDRIAQSFKISIELLKEYIDMILVKLNIPFQRQLLF